MWLALLMEGAFELMAITAISGSAPKIFAKCTKRGIPLYAVMTVCAFGLLSFLNVGRSSTVVFSWFVSIVSGAHLRFLHNAELIFLADHGQRPLQLAYTRHLVHPLQQGSRSSGHLPRSAAIPGILPAICRVLYRRNEHLLHPHYRLRRIPPREFLCFGLLLGV